MVKSNFLRATLLLSLLLLGLWLWKSSGGSDSRLRAINALISKGEMGRVDPKRQALLEKQITWIAKAAGVKEEIRVNGEIGTGVLTFVVTKPDYKDLTRCGPGNAIYDSELDTVFIDEALAFPEELTVIGEDSDWSMVDLDTVGFVRGYLNFILAHELGHRQQRHPSAGFFNFNVRSLFRGTRRQEVAADEFAISTLLKAYTSGGEETHPLLEFFDSREFLGFTGQGEMEIRQRYYVDLVASMIMMNKLLLFSQSPYSPYFFDESHPNFIERSTTALASLKGSDLSEQLQSHLPVVSDELRRLKSLETVNYLELHLNPPALRVRSTDSHLIIGGRALGRRFVGGAIDPGQASVYRLDKSDIAKSLEKGHRVMTLQPFMTFPEHTSDKAAEFIEDVFKGQNKELAGQLFGGVDASLEKARFFSENWHFAGNGIRITYPDGTEHELSEQSMRETLRAEHGLDDLEFSEGVLGEDGVYVTLYQASSFAGILKLDNSLNRYELLVPNVPEEFRQRTAVNSAAYPLGGRKFLMVALESTPERSRWSLYSFDMTGEPERLFSYELLEGQIGSSGTAEYRRDLDPGTPKVFLVSRRHAVVSFPRDSVYHVNLDTRQGRVIFHPGYEKLSITKVSENLIAVWTYNSYKIFLIDLEHERRA